MSVARRCRRPDPVQYAQLERLFYTAPYLHDGSAATLHDVLEQTRGAMGNINGLSEDDLDALVAYLETL